MYKAFARAILVITLAGVTLFAMTFDRRVLRVSASHLLTVPAFSSWGVTRCDGDQNLYYRPVIARAGYNSSVLMRLDPSTETPTLFQMPPELVDQTAFIGSWVTISGRVWLLDQMKDQSYTIFGFDSNGEVNSKSHLDTPKSIFLDRFAVAEDSVALVGGYFPKDAGKDLEGKQFLSIVDRSGRVRKSFGPDVIKDLDLAGNSFGTLGNPVTVGTDGNFYFLERNKILVISEWGDLVREMQFEPPDGSSTPVGLELSEGLLSIEFVTQLPGDEHLLRPEFLVLQSATGAPLALYEPSEELGTVYLCFTRKAGFLFQKIENGKLMLLSAALR